MSTYHIFCFFFDPKLLKNMYPNYHLGHYYESNMYVIGKNNRPVSAASSGYISSSRSRLSSLGDDYSIANNGNQRFSMANNEDAQKIAYQSYGPQRPKLSY